MTNGKMPDRGLLVDSIAGGTITVPGGYGELQRDDAESIVDALLPALTAAGVAPQESSEPKQCGPCRRGQHGCCDGNEYVRCDDVHAAPSPDREKLVEKARKLGQRGWYPLAQRDVQELLTACAAALAAPVAVDREKLAEAVMSGISDWSKAHSEWNCGESESYPGDMPSFIASRVVALLGGGER